MNDNNYRCLLSHIVLGLSVIVFYKLAKHYNLMQTINLQQKTTEPFTDPMTSSINDFISGASLGNSILTNNQAKTLSPTDLASYNDKLTQLINVLNDIKTQQISTPANVSVSPDNIQKLDLESQQQYQMFQIDYLNKQIQNAKDIINAQTVANTSTNYKPIKVYSSCVISNANGSTTLDVPVKPNTTAITPQGIPNPATQQMLQTIGQSNPLLSGTSTATIGSGAGSTPNQFINLAPSTGVFGSLLNNMAKGNVNINL